MMNNYEEEMLKAFVNKPEKYEWYKFAFNTYDLNGTPTMKWVWSWWAFFGGSAFLLYRKTYLPALVTFMISVVLSFIAPIALIFAILVGGYGTYFIYKRYLTKKFEIESKFTDNNDRILEMQKVGGYNQWVVWFYYVLLAIMVIGIIAAVIIPKVAN